MEMAKLLRDPPPDLNTAFHEIMTITVSRHGVEFFYFKENYENLTARLRMESYCRRKVVFLL